MNEILRKLRKFSSLFGRRSRLRSGPSHLFRTVTQSTTLSRRALVLCAIIFFLALGVRFLQWQDQRIQLEESLTTLTDEYKLQAHLLLNGDLGRFLRGPNPPSDANTLRYPPGYSILMAAVYKIFGNSDATLRLFHIAFGAAAAVLVFFTAAELLPESVATIAGVLVALSPQLAFFSLFLLADPLAPLPILLAIYCLIRAYKQPGMSTMILSGIFAGLSCWLRANALLLSPFLAILAFFLLDRKVRLRYSLALVGATVLTIAPLTLRNYVVFHRFIPISLSAGTTMLLGIGDYDKEKRFGMPMTDLEVIRQEAEMYKRPDYYGGLYAPDGIEREHARMARGLEIVRAHPVWFAGTMIGRAGSMLRLSRDAIVSAEPAVSHSLEITSDKQPVWTNTPADLRATANVLPKQSEISLAADEQTLHITADDSRWDEQVSWGPIAVQRNADYILRVPVRVEQGNAVIRVASVDQRLTLASTPILNVIENQPTTVIRVPFVTRDTTQINLVLGNGGSKSRRTALQLGRMEIFHLGPASHLLTRYPRMLIRTLQKFFVTAWMLPLTFTGVLLLIWAGQGRTAAILAVVTVYYMCTQSALISDYRYVQVIHYFHFIFAAVALYWIGHMLREGLRRLGMSNPSPSNR